jgi:hypothetical protein
MSDGQMDEWTSEATALQNTHELRRDGGWRCDVGGHDIIECSWVAQWWWTTTQCWRPRCCRSNFFFLLVCLLFPRRSPPLLFYCSCAVLLFSTCEELCTLCFVFVHASFSLSF